MRINTIRVKLACSHKEVGLRLGSSLSAVKYTTAPHVDNNRVTTLQREKIPDFFVTFPDEIADNISNKCTFVSIKSASYEVSVAFQQLNIRYAKRIKSTNKVHVN